MGGGLTDCSDGWTVVLGGRQFPDRMASLSRSTIRSGSRQLWEGRMHVRSPLPLSCLISSSGR